MNLKRDGEKEVQLNGIESEKNRPVFYESRLRERLCLAATMGASLLLLSGYEHFGGAEHEHLSIGFMALLFLHLVLNRKQQITNRLSGLVKNAFVLAVSFCLVSGVLLSRYDFPFFPNLPHAEQVVSIHLASACWCLVLAGLHVGLQMKCYILTVPRWIIFPGRILVYALSFYGVVTLVTTRFAVYLVAGSYFGTQDSNVGSGEFFLQRAAIFALAAWVAQRIGRGREKTR
ncbi:MAG TPA: hypothetical protein DD376_01975 [Sutterella sp.]|nr:hypothetical protein [Sutterella sp.]